MIVVDSVAFSMMDVAFSMMDGVYVFGTRHEFAPNE